MPWATGQNADVTDFRGFIVPYAGQTPPSGWLLCDGSPVSRTTYAGLFALIGTTYGAGDGSTTFNVPDLRGSVVVGAGQRVRIMTFDGASAVNPTTDEITVASNEWLYTGQAVALAGASLPTGLSAGTYYAIRASATVIKLASSLADAQNGIPVNITADGSGACTLTQTLASRALGATGGEETHAMSEAELLAHDHGYNDVAGIDHVHIEDSSGGGAAGGGSNDGTWNFQTDGGNQAMNVMPPFTVLNFIIKH